MFPWQLGGMHFVNLFFKCELFFQEFRNSKFLCEPEGQRGKEKKKRGVPELTVTDAAGGYLPRGHGMVARGGCHHDMASASVYVYVYVYALVLLLLSGGALAQQKEKITQQQQENEPGGYDDAIQVGVTRPGAAMAGLENLTLAALQAAPLAALEGTGDGGGDRFSAPSSGFGPVDRVRLESLKELLDHLNFRDLHLDLQERKAVAGGLGDFLADGGDYTSVATANYTALLSGLDLETQREIDTAATFFSASSCFFPLNGRSGVSQRQWVFYLASRAQSYGEEDEDEIPWRTFPILCQNATFEIPQWLGAYEWMNDLISSLSTPVYTTSVGRIPETIGNLRNLQTLSLHGAVTGRIPRSLGRLHKLTALFLQNNQIDGSIPRELGNCTGLMKVWLYDNKLEGEIPDEFADLRNLEELYLQDNALTGPTPLTPALAGVGQRLGPQNFVYYGNPMAGAEEEVAPVQTPANQGGLEGWEIALVVVAVGLAGATIAVAVGWSLRRSRQTAGSRSDDFLDDCERSAHCCINRKDLKLIKVVGRGTYGSVFEAKWNDIPVAVKIMNVHDSQVASREESRKYIQSFEKEVELLSEFRHANIVQLFGYSLVSPHIYIVQELMAKNLSELTRSKGYVPDDIQILGVIEDIATGLAYLHPRIVHMDLKPQNILLSKEGRAKIADFGISKGKQGTFIQFTKQSHVPGSVIYMAPECFNSPEEVGEKCDVYSLAMILWECYTGCEPWEELPGPINVVNAVAVRGRRPLMPPNVPKDVAKLIIKCWQTDYHRRPSCAEIAKLCQLMKNDRHTHGNRPASRTV